jgi:hypothetical protein
VPLFEKRSLKIELESADNAACEHSFEMNDGLHYGIGDISKRRRIFNPAEICSDPALVLFEPVAETVNGSLAHPDFRLPGGLRRTKSLAKFFQETGEKAGKNHEIPDAAGQQKGPCPAATASVAPVAAENSVSSSHRIFFTVAIEIAVQDEESQTVTMRTRKNLQICSNR